MKRVQKRSNKTTKPLKVKEEESSFHHEFFHGGMAKTSGKTEANKKKSLHRCHFCSKEFSKNFDLTQHIRSHTGEKPFQCIVCGRAFAQKSNVKKHMEKHRVWPQGSIYSTIRKDSVVISKKEDPTSPPSVIINNYYSCQICENKFRTYSDLRTHMIVHNESKVYRCVQKYCSKTFAKLGPFIEHVETHDKDLEYHCHTCLKVFNTLEDLGQHHHLNHSINPSVKTKMSPSYYRCTECMNNYSSREALDHHLKTSTHHFPCQHCNKVFACDRHLRRHLTTHYKVNAYKCPQCSKSFKTDYYLKMHMLIHTGEKPHECQVCKTAFNRKDKLKRHMLIHGPKKFKCPFKDVSSCVREFNRQDKLQHHINTFHLNVKKNKKKSSSKNGSSEKDNSSKQPYLYFCLKCNQGAHSAQHHVCNEKLIKAKKEKEDESYTSLPEVDSPQTFPGKNDIDEHIDNLNIKEELSSYEVIEIHQDYLEALPDPKLQSISSNSENLALTSINIDESNLVSDSNVSNQDSNRFDDNILDTPHTSITTQELPEIDNFSMLDKGKLSKDTLSLSSSDVELCDSINISDDKKNFAIIYIPFSLTRNMDADMLMNVDCSKDEPSLSSTHLLTDEGTPQSKEIILDEESLLVSESVDGLTCTSNLLSLDSLDSPVLRNETPLQVIVSSASNGSSQNGKKMDCSLSKGNHEGNEADGDCSKKNIEVYCC